MSDSFPRIGSFEQFQIIGSQKQIEALRQGANTSVRDASKMHLLLSMTFYIQNIRKSHFKFIFIHTTRHSANNKT